MQIIILFPQSGSQAGLGQRVSAPITAITEIERLITVSGSEKSVKTLILHTFVIFVAPQDITISSTE